MLLNDCRMRFLFDEKWSIAIGWNRTANHFFVNPLFLVSILKFPVNNRGISFAWLEMRDS
jgi:hypothetical protein